MKKTLALFIGVLINSNWLTAQDQLFKIDKSKLQVKVIEINSDFIKYKLYNNLNGPVYSELKNNVLLILYESGKHEVITPVSQSLPESYNSGHLAGYLKMERADSLKYYKYVQGISINFLSFLNNEISLIYQKDFLSRNFGIAIPLAIGLGKPSATQETFYERPKYNSYGEMQLTLIKKNIEAGFGIHYYPNLKTNFNYYIGPVFRFIQFEADNEFFYYNASGSSNGREKITSHNNVNRYSFSITNGFIIRSKSRLFINLFVSMGFKHDVAEKEFINPVTNTKINPIHTPTDFNIWCGFNVGFAF